MKKTVKKKMTYQETIGYLYEKLPVFQRDGKNAFKPGLENIKKFLARLNHPEKDMSFIHVGGTNGKGSVSHMLSSVLQTAGYKTGLYTSPHLKDFRERIKVNGKEITEEEVVDFVEHNKDFVEQISPSFFEVTVALALHFFARQEVDIAVIEVGMGGRLDSTNVINPVVSVITNIGYDHMAYLGDTLEKIAFEKAGIIKEKIPVILGESRKETNQVFAKAANMKRSPVFFADEAYSIISLGQKNPEIQAFKATLYNDVRFATINTDLLGWYQQKNLGTALMVIDVMKDLGWSKINDEAFIRGLAAVKKNTGLRGRWDIICRDPMIICDTAHNFNGLEWVFNQLQEMSFTRLHIVFGMVKDKDAGSILSLLPKEAVYYFTKASIPRSLDEKVLQEKAHSFGLRGNCFTTVYAALEAARKDAGKNDLIFVGGSTFVVGEIL